MKRILLICFALMLAVLMTAIPARAVSNVTVTVVDLNTNAPLEGATVQRTNNTLQVDGNATTNPSGQVVFSDCVYGQYSFSAVKNSYSETSVNLFVEYAPAYGLFIKLPLSYQHVGAGSGACGGVVMMASLCLCGVLVVRVKKA